MFYNKNNENKIEKYINKEYIILIIVKKYLDYY
jgi:hypothetical protein